MRIAILTGGGDVAPLNAVIAAAISACQNSDIELIGIMKGWEGLLENRFLPLSKEIVNPEIGGTILKSSRVNLKIVPDGPAKVFNALRKNDINGLIVIGGEDTLSNALYIKDFPKILISKTIDNDVGRYVDGKFLNHFTLGHPTAAEKISSIVSFQEGVRTTAYSHERIIVVESMGMHAGWLALSSSLGNPDFIIIPEFPLHYESFVEKVKEKYLKQRHLVIVISEGARWHNGEYISADEKEKDGFGHPRFRGTAEVLASRLKETLKPFFDTRNVNSVNPSYLYRSGKPNELDSKMARIMGQCAVKELITGNNESVFLASDIQGTTLHARPFDFNSLENIEQYHRFIDSELYDKDNYQATEAAHNYWSTISTPFLKIH